MSVIELAALGCFTLAFLTQGDVSVWFLLAGLTLSLYAACRDDN